MKKRNLDLQLFTTMVGDMEIPPTAFQNYIYDKTKTLTPLAQSGVYYTSTELDALAGGSGLTFTIPYVDDLDGEATVMVDGEMITPEKVGTKSMTGHRIILEKAWSKTDLSQVLSGVDPLGELQERMARYWARQEQVWTISLMESMKNVLSDTHTFDTEGTKLNASNILKAKQKLGDADADLSILLMHSTTRTDLQSQNLIEVVEDSNGVVLFERYLGYKVVYFDSIPYDAETKETTTYLVGAGVVGRGEGFPVGLETFETDRNSLGASRVFISRRSLVMHPTGLSFVGAVTNQFPTLAEFTDTTSWKKVFEDKKIPFVAIDHVTEN